MTIAANYPRFVVGDDRKALRVTIRDSNNAVVDPSTGTTRLYAVGFDNANRPGSPAGGGDTINSVLGVYGPSIVDSDANLAVEFQGLGALCDIETSGVTRRAQVYSFRVQFTATSGGLKSRSAPESHFVVEAWP